MPFIEMMKLNESLSLFFGVFVSILIFCVYCVSCVVCVCANFNNNRM